ncbi:MAG: type II toxin-antitoxin system RelE/ParE family toxin [Bacteroidota bacterium]|nr:type II toxin-antitoxin system RelE/ParE family toxin [Bacteroidota bacterium]
MPKQVVWSPLSEGDFAMILDYLYKNWDEKVAIQFINLTESILGQIAINPRQFPIINKKKRIRKCVLTKHNTMYYRDGKSQVEILRIFDTRQDPNTLIYK